MRSRKLEKEHEQMIGKTFGSLMVIERTTPYVWTDPNTNKKTKRTRWLCKCVCGEISCFWDTKLRKGLSTRCISCGYRTRPQSQKTLKEYERLFRLKVLGRCLKKGLECDITLEQFISLVTSNCFYCNAEPIWVRYDDHVILKKEFKKCGGIDRIDSNKGYTIENCRPCCKICNTAKGQLSELDFKKWIKKIHDFYILRDKDDRMKTELE